MVNQSLNHVDFVAKTADQSTTLGDYVKGSSAAKLREFITWGYVFCKIEWRIAWFKWAFMFDINKRTRKYRIVCLNSMDLWNGIRILGWFKFDMTL